MVTGWGEGWNGGGAGGVRGAEKEGWGDSMIKRRKPAGRGRGSDNSRVGKG